MSGHRSARRKLRAVDADVARRAGRPPCGGRKPLCSARTCGRSERSNHARENSHRAATASSASSCVSASRTALTAEAASGKSTRIAATSDHVYSKEGAVKMWGATSSPGVSVVDVGVSTARTTRAGSAPSVSRASSREDRAASVMASSSRTSTSSPLIAASGTAITPPRTGGKRTDSSDRTAGT